MTGLAEAIAHEALLFAAAAFCVVGIDDLAVDAIWLGRLARLRLLPDRTGLEALMPRDRQARFAVFVPAWEEAPVIGSMLAMAAMAYRRHEAVFFVGCYPNDPATAETARALNLSNVEIAVNALHGPTTKGDALNTCWHAMLQREQRLGLRFDAIILHDAEDLVCAGEAATFTQWLRRYDFMQLPVVPLPQPKSRWIAGHYCDEFAESHLKSLVVRATLGASIPSAGVGCCIARDLLSRIAAHRDGLPFAPDSLTEDYELGLLAKEIGAATAFLRVSMPEPVGPVCTRSRFPDRLSAVVRQKSRWIAGITLAGWDRIGWTLSPVEMWMRWRDRRALIEAAALASGYFGLAMFGPLALLDLTHSSALFSGAGGWLVGFATFCMVWRAAVRMMCTTHVYGWREGLWAIPRTIVSNLVAILAAVRAVHIYVAMLRTGLVRWDKTEHSFPSGEAA